MHSDMEADRSRDIARKQRRHSQAARPLAWEGRCCCRVVGRQQGRDGAGAEEIRAAAAAILFIAPASLDGLTCTQPLSTL